MRSLHTQGALDMSRKTAEAAMTPLNKVFMLSSESVLDEATLQSVLASGHSRIPVYERRNRCSAAVHIDVRQSSQPC